RILHLTPPHPPPTLFPYTTLFRSLPETGRVCRAVEHVGEVVVIAANEVQPVDPIRHLFGHAADVAADNRSPVHERLADHQRSVRSEEHTSELQSPYDLVCRLLLEK